MKFLKVFFTFVFFAALVGTAQAQDEETIKIETNLVSVGVIVKDKKGNFVKNLTKEQFEIFDNNQKRTAEFFSTIGAPVSFGFVYDLHPTTTEQTKTILNALKKFTSDLPKSDDFFTLVFNEKGSLTVDFVPSVEQVEKQIETDDKTKPKSLYDAIYLAGEKLRKRENSKKTLVIISDGKDHNSHHTYSTLSIQLRALNVQIYSILLDDKEGWDFSDISLDQQRRAVDFDDLSLDRAALEELSAKSGGKAEAPFLKNSIELLRILSQVKSELDQQYSLGFYPESDDNDWHKIKVRIKDANYKLTYRKGYQNRKTK